MRLGLLLLSGGLCLAAAAVMLAVNFYRKAG